MTQLAELEDHQLVCLDEAGIDDTDDYAYGYCLKGKRFEAERKDSSSQTADCSWDCYSLTYA